MAGYNLVTYKEAWTGVTSHGEANVTVTGVFTLLDGSLYVFVCGYSGHGALLRTVFGFHKLEVLLHDICLASK